MSERKLGFFVQIKEDDPADGGINRRNTLSISRIKFESDVPPRREAKKTVLVQALFTGVSIVQAAYCVWHFGIFDRRRRASGRSGLGSVALSSLFSTCNGLSSISELFGSTAP